MSLNEVSVTQRQVADIEYGVWQAIASGAQTIFPAIDVSERLRVDFGFFFGLDSATAPVGLQFRVQKSLRSTGTDSWITVDTIVTPVIAPTAIATDGDEAAGSTVIECGASVPVVGDLILFKNATITQSEIREVKSRVITGGSESVTLMEGLSYGQAAGTYYTQAQKYSRSYDAVGAARFRVVANNAYAASSPTAVIRVDELMVLSMQRAPKYSY